MNRLERKAALAVAAATAGVIVSGVSLIKKHTKYLTQKAAATFDPQEEDEELTKEALAAGTDGETSETAENASASDTAESGTSSGTAANT